MKDFHTTAPTLMGVLAAGMVLLSVSSSAANAYTLPPINTYGSRVQSSTCFSECRGGGIDAINAVSSSSYSSAYNKTILSKTPSITAFAEANLPVGTLGGTYFSTGAVGASWLKYWVRLDGPTNTSIPVNLAAKGLIKVTGDFDSTGYSFSAQAHLSVLGPDGFIYDREIFNNLSDAKDNAINNDFTADQNFQMLTGEFYQVSMYVIASASIQAYGDLSIYDNLTSYAFIDPSFTFDPVYNSTYSLAFSDGLGGNVVTPVPLPHGIALLGAALAILAFAHNGARRCRGVCARSAVDVTGRIQAGYAKAVVAAVRIR